MCGFGLASSVRSSSFVVPHHIASFVKYLALHLAISVSGSWLGNRLGFLTKLKRRIHSLVEGIWDIEKGTVDIDAGDGKAALLL